MSDYSDSDDEAHFNDFAAAENEDSIDEDGYDSENQHQMLTKSASRKRKLWDDEYDSENQEDDNPQRSKKLKQENEEPAKSEGGLVYATMFTPEVAPQVSLSITGCKTKLNPNSKYFPQTVRFHEIKSGGGGSREVFVDNLVDQNEKGLISRGIVTIDSLVYVVPFFDLDIKCKDMFSTIDDIIQFVKEFISYILPLIKECDFVFSSRPTSNGLHFFLPKYRIYRYGLKKVTEILKVYIEKKFRDVDVDEKISHFCLPGNCKPGVVEPYKILNTDKNEPYIFPTKDSIVLPIKFPGLSIMINKFFLKQAKSEESDENHELDENNEPDENHELEIDHKNRKSKYFLRSIIELFLQKVTPCTHQDENAHVQERKCKECKAVSKLTFDYMTHKEGEFRRIVYLIVLSIFDTDEAQSHIHQFAKKYDWRQFDHKYLDTFKKLSQKTARHLTREYIKTVHADLETFINSKRYLALIPYTISEHVIPPSTIIEWVWSYGDGIPENENTLFGWIIFTCYSNITNKCEDSKLSKIQLVQMILENQQRFGYLIQTIYKLIIKKNPMTLYDRFCKIVGWELEPNYQLEYESDISYKNDGVITAKAICTEIVYNLIIGKDLNLSHITLSTDDTNIATFCFNRLFFDYMLGIDSKGMTPAMVKEYQKPKLNIVEFLCNFFPIVIDNRTAKIMMLGRVVNLSVTTLYFTLKKIFEDYFTFDSYQKKTFDISSLYNGVFSRSAIYAVVTSDGKLLTHNKIIDNTYSLVTMCDSTLGLDSKFLQNTNLLIEKETIENLCCTEDSGHNSMFYALQYLYLLMNFNWDETMKLLQYFRDCMNYNGYKTLVIFYGKGCNGKTWLMNTIMKLFGAYATTIQKNNFAKQSRDHQGDLVASKNSTIIMVDECDILSAEIDKEKLKNMSGGGFISVRSIRENAQKMRIQASLLFSCNFIGTTTDVALKNRITVFEFSNKVCNVGDAVITDLRKGICLEYTSKGNSIPLSSSKHCQDFLLKGLQKLVIGSCNISAGYEWKKSVPSHIATNIYASDDSIFYNFTKEQVDVFKP